MEKTVLITAIGSFSAGAVIADCRRSGYRIVGCDIYPAEWIVNSIDVDVFYKAPYATDYLAYRKFLKTVCEEEHVDFLLPLTDVEIDVLQAWPEADTALHAVICMSGYKTIALCRNKDKMEAFLRENSVCRTIPGRKLSEVMANGAGGAETGQNGEEWTYPMILKPVDGRSSQGLRIIESEDELKLAAEQCRVKGQEETGWDRYILQPQIDGVVVTVDIVRCPETGKSVCLPRRELLRTPNGAGTSVRVFRNEELERQCRAIADVLDIRGCVNFEFIETASSEWYFLECNPRFSGGVAFSCMAGYDMVKNHLKCFTGQEIEPEGEIRDQYIARRYTEYRMEEGDTNERKA